MLFALGIFVIFLGAAAFHNQPVHGSWPLTVTLAGAVGFLIAYGVPFLASRDADLVAISERGVGRRVMEGGHISLKAWAWEQVAYCSLKSMTLEGVTYSVLVLHSENGELALFALRPKVEIEAIEAAIRENGKELRR
jgi:hypothetical protein